MVGIGLHQFAIDPGTEFPSFKFATCKTESSPCAGKPRGGGAFGESLQIEADIKFKSSQLFRGLQNLPRGVIDRKMVGVFVVALAGLPTATSVSTAPYGCPASRAGAGSTKAIFPLLWARIGANMLLNREQR